MKLLQHTGRYYFWSSVLVFLVGGGVLFLTMYIVINSEADERLREVKPVLQTQLEAMDSLPSVITFLDNVIEISPLLEFSPFEKFVDTLHWNPVEQEQEPYRKFIYHTQINNKPYRIALHHSKLDNEELIKTVVANVLVILGLLLLAINLFNRYLSLRLWRPFYRTIQQIKGFDFDIQKPLSPPMTNIDEFQVLNHALELMTTKVLNDYRSLKQFTENASHEIQTPLAVIKSQVELLIQKENWEENEQQALQKIQESASRLSKLNNSLLLLTRIENRQYTNIQQLDFKQLLVNKLNQLEPLISAKNLHVYTDLTQGSHAMDPALAEILLNNLLGNAIKHNLADGTIEVTLREKRLTIRNTGKPLTAPPEKLFERFRKDVDASPSLGLGLAIVKEICLSYGFEVKYEFENEWHELTISFGIGNKE